MTPELSSLPVLRHHYDTGGTVADVVAAVRDRLTALDDPAVLIGTLADDLDQQASRLDALTDAQRSTLPLFGVPVVVKDNIDVAGMPTTAGCPTFGRHPTADADAVAHLRAAGAVIAGKTNLDQFATGLVGTRSPYGVPRNVLDPVLIPGGSSSGSAVAVAAGIVPIALGTDTAGSGRVPAAMNQIIGLKPTRGIVSTVGVVPACASLDCVSVFATSVADAWEVLRVLDRPSLDPWRRDARPTKPLVAMAGLQVGIPSPDALDDIDATILASYQLTLGDLAARGAGLVTVDLAPFLDAGRRLYGGPFVGERFASIGQFVLDHPDDVGEPTRMIITDAAAHTAADYHESWRTILERRDQAAKVWDAVDVIAVPTVPDAPTLADVDADPVAANNRLGRFTSFANLLDLCALTLPDVVDRRPGCGLTMYGPAGADAVVATVAAAACQEPTPVDHAPGCVDVVVIGAHLSGHPLNHELTDRGATLARRATTTAAYRLWALPDGRRPALQHAGDGSAIDVEVWSLPETELGSFVAAVARPLAIGHVELADGTRPLGFVCELGGQDGAVDITEYGGWVAYLASRDGATV